MDNPSRSAAFQIDEWLIEPPLNQLSSNGRIVRVEPKVMEVLVCLAQNAGKPVSKEQFMSSVWAGTVVTDDVLSRCISELRKIFGDSPKKPHYIETIRKRGYRLVQPVEKPEPTVQETAVAAHSPAVEESQQERSTRLWNDVKKELGRRADDVWQNKSNPWIWGSVVGVVAAVVLMLFFANQIFFPDEVTEPPPRSVPFTSFPGEELDPALDPTGERVAFSWTGTGDNFDIYVKQIGGETPLQLTTDEGDERSPSWSPDGLKIAYIASDNGLNSIRSVPALGGSVRQLAEFGLRTISNIVWSPDGTTLAVSAQNEVYGAFSIYLLSVETLELVELTHPPRYYHGDTAPSFSKDGQSLAFVRGVSGQIQDIYSASIASGGNPRRLTSDYAEVTGLAWSDNNIVFASVRGGTSNLWRIARTGGTPEWIASAGDDASVSQVSTSAESNLLTYARQTSDVNIWRYDVGVTPKALIASTRWDSNPDISPDGSKIAYVSDKSGSYEVWTSDANGENSVQLTNLGGPLASMPKWSPDGSKIAFVTWQAGAADIFTIESAGGTPQPVVTSEAEDIAPSWSADGRHLYFSSNRNNGYQIWKTDLTHDSEPVQVTSIGGLSAFESDDGGAIYFVRPNEPGIWKIDNEANEIEMVIDTLDPTDWGNWELANNGIYMVRRYQGKALVTFYSFRTNRSTNIATLTNVPVDPGFSISSDGSWFLYSRIDRAESDIVLMEESG